jgi:hypothetical protein
MLGWTLLKMVGKWKFMAFTLYATHLDGRGLPFPRACDARLICAAGPFVGRTGRISLAR